ncbi:NrdH-redoxin [Candidatus Woesearchaeota archaeon]|nr:MAG: NrdH-redoxin [Candidatus Woesearchaeota archaeon]
MPRVIVYSTPTCPYCEKTKEFLAEHNIDFEDVNVAEDRERAMEMVEKSGQMGVPVTDIDGEIIVGYDPAAFKKALGLE